MKSGWKWLAVAVVAGGAATAAFYLERGGDGGDAAYRYAEVDRGPIARTVSSSGNINPVITVTVGSQVSGQISALNADYNTAVKAGQVIARIDPRPFEAKVQEARAELAFAKANVAIQKAALAEYRAEETGAVAALGEADQDLARKKALLARRVVAASALDTSISAQAQARADLNSARAKLQKQAAQIQSAGAQVEQKEATLRQRELELEHTFIRSPVDGIVIARNVDIGQTVAASLQAPELFAIAQDLRRMQVDTSVDEADIGRIREGQDVAFTVDAYPDRSFAGTVQQIRKAPLEVNNVITYTVVVTADNPDLALLPGMTANVEIITGRREETVRVPNAALRFTPPGATPPQGGSRRAQMSVEERRAAARKRTEDRIARLDKRLGLTENQKAQIAELYAEMGRAAGRMFRSGASRDQVRQTMIAMRADTSRKIEGLLNEDQRRKFRVMQAESDGTTRPGTVWVDGDGGAPKAVPVVTGLSDGNRTEIRRGDLKPGDRVMVGLALAAPGAR